MIFNQTFKHFVLVSTLIFAHQAQAQFRGEFTLVAAFGGTDFEQEGTPSYDHTRAWDFSYNQGFSLGLRGGYKMNFIEVGVGFEGGWKEEAINKENETTGDKDMYDFQVARVFLGPHIKLYPVKDVVHIYLGYDPLVQSRVVYADDRHINPFRKNDEFKGTAVSFGLGFETEGLVIRFLGRKITNTEMDTIEGSQKDLPNATYSKVTTDEFVFQFGRTF